MSDAPRIRSGFLRRLIERSLARIKALFHFSYRWKWAPEFAGSVPNADTEHLNAAAARRAEAPLATNVLSRSSSSGLQGALCIRLMIRFVKCLSPRGAAKILELTGYGSVPFGPHESGNGI
jgi:hypothetical protein